MGPKFDHTFDRLDRAGPQRGFGGFTVTRNAAGEIIIEGGIGTPVVNCVETTGVFTSTGNKTIDLFALIQPVGAAVPAIGFLALPGQVKAPPRIEILSMDFVEARGEDRKGLANYFNVRKDDGKQLLVPKAGPEWVMEKEVGKTLGPTIYIQNTPARAIVKLKITFGPGEKAGVPIKVKLFTDGDLKFKPEGGDGNDEVAIVFDGNGTS